MAGAWAVAPVTTCLMVANYSTLMKRALFALAFLSASAHAQTVVWNKWDPMAVRADRTVDVVLELQTSGAVSAVRLDYANGGSIALTQSVPGRWTASVPAAKVLDDYKTDDVNHNL